MHAKEEIDEKFIELYVARVAMSRWNAPRRNTGRTWNAQPDTTHARILGRIRTRLRQAGSAE